MAPKTSLAYVLVAPCIPLMGHGHEAYTYHVEVAEKLVEGSVVRISFGKRKILGVVLQVDVKRPQYPTKPITTILDTVLTSHQMQFATLLAGAVHGGLGFTLRLFIPHSV
ncbi:MAG: hypothetical protein O3A36_00615 [bacterium]|nr:hypothetical protein [bacterium]